MATAESRRLLLDQLIVARRTLVERLADEAPLMSPQLRDLADTQQAIAAIEAVMAERDAATGGIPLRKT